MKIRKFCLILIILLVSLGWSNNYHGTAIAMSNQNNWKGWVVAIDTGLVLHSPNRGVNWISQSFLTSRYFFDVFFLDTLKGWIGTDQGFIYNTDDGGVNWTIQVMGISKHVARILFIDDNYGWAACGAAIIGRTNQGGQNWSWEQIQLSNPPFPSETVDFYGVSFVNRAKGWMCAGRYPELISDTFRFTRGQGYIAVSNDSGFNWQLQRRDTVYDFFDIRFKDALNGYVVGGNDRTNAGIIMKTTDGGQNWQSVTIPTQAKILRALENVGNHWWAVGRNGTIIPSSDNGNTWVNQQSNVDTTLFDVDFCDTLHGLVSGNSCVLYTNNGGDTWHIANAGLEEINSIPIIHNFKSKIYAFPNPFHSQITFNISELTSNNYNLQIYNAVGNLVKTVTTRHRQLIWEGKDSYGRTVPPGVYFAVVRTKDGTSTAPIIYQK